MADILPPWDNPWQTLYRTAIFGRSPSSMSRRIAEAEEAIAIRKRELAQKKGPWVDAEREAMDDALYALKALRTTLKSPKVRAGKYRELV